MPDGLYRLLGFQFACPVRIGRSSSGCFQVSSRTAQRVRVSVIDALGRRTQLLLDATMAAEEVRVLQLDSEQFPAGTSVVWVEASGVSDRIVQRIVLLR